MGCAPEQNVVNPNNIFTLLQSQVSQITPTCGSTQVRGGHTTGPGSQCGAQQSFLHSQVCPYTGLCDFHHKEALRARGTAAPLCLESPKILASSHMEHTETADAHSSRPCVNLGSRMTAYIRGPDSFRCSFLLTHPRRQQVDGSSDCAPATLMGGSDPALAS